MDKRFVATVLSVSVALSSCANMDSKTEGAVVGGALGCAVGAVVAKLTKNDAGAGCVGGALVGGLIGYQRARSMEIAEANKAAEVASRVEGAKVTPVETQQVHVTDKQTKKTETVSAFKSVSVDIPVRQLNTPEGREAVAKLEAYARKVAAERADTIDMTIAAAPDAGGSANKVTLKTTMETSGKGKVRRNYVADPRVPGNVQRFTVEAKNQSRMEV